MSASPGQLTGRGLKRVEDVLFAVSPRIARSIDRAWIETVDRSCTGGSCVASPGQLTGRGLKRRLVIIVSSKPSIARSIDRAWIET